MKTPTPQPPRSRGIGGVQKPGQGKHKSSGIGDLRNPRIDGGGPTKAIPREDEPVIQAMESAAQDGRTAGAQGEEGRHPAGSQRGNLPMGVGELVAPPGWNVP